MGRLEAIWIKRAKRGKMDPVKEAQIIAGKGLKNNANQGGRRQVTLIELETWQWLLKQLNIDLDPSVRRANLLVSGIDLINSLGKVLKIGQGRLRILGETKPCERMDEASPGLKNLMWPEWRGGAFAEVLNSTIIRTGADVSWEEVK